jgi:hypothetical protein
MHAPRHWLKYWLKKWLVFFFYDNSKEVAGTPFMNWGPMHCKIQTLLIPVAQPILAQ